MQPTKKRKEMKLYTYIEGKRKSRKEIQTKKKQKTLSFLIIEILQFLK